jgi:hypothetical protein
MVPLMVSRLVSSLQPTKSDEDAIIFGHVIYRARHPDLGSKFEQFTHHLNSLFDSDLFQTLLNLNYDGMIFTENGAVVGDVFWQALGGSGAQQMWKLFALSVNEELRNKRYGTEQVRQLLTFAHIQGVGSMIIGDGKHPLVARIHQRIIEGRMGLPFRITPGTTPYLIHLENPLRKVG